MPLVSAAIAIGSNLGDRAEHLRGAVDDLGQLPGTRLLAVSDAIETPAVRVGEVDPGGPYLNAAVVVRTSLSPRELMGCLHDLESQHGRDRRAPRGSPRTLDLDLLLFGDEALDERPCRSAAERGGLVVPHPHLHEREFMLRPLAQIAPEWVVPGLGRSVADLLAGLMVLRVPSSTRPSR